MSAEGEPTGGDAAAVACEPARNVATSVWRAAIVASASASVGPCVGVAVNAGTGERVADGVLLAKTEEAMALGVGDAESVLTGTGVHVGGRGTLVGVGVAERAASGIAVTPM